MNGGERIRAFIALKTPAEWDEKLKGLQEELARRLGKAGKFRWIKPGQLHLTLRFFGQITPAEADQVAVDLKTAARESQPFSLEYTGLGCFPRCSSPRVLWAGIKDNSESLRRLHERVVELTKEIGKPPEGRSFNPHLTLARIENFRRSESGALEKAIEETGGLISSAWEVSKVLLMRSHLSPQGARYEPLAEEVLGA